ncbi:MAG: hypothetical protein JW940_01275, partial [Polyangiaceae bacterium]|nr:hypothetical protein [Polyangiaceae bacterium]
MGCQDSSTYGEGTPCSPSKPCRPPLVCEDGRCALPQGGAAGAPSTAGNSNAGGDNHSDTANGGMGGDGDANART